jgi:hypothetical protein
MADLFSQVNLTVVDNVGTKADMTTYWVIPDGTTIAANELFYGTVIKNIDDITDGQIIRARLSVDLMPAALTAGIKTAPAVPSRVEETGLFNFSQDTSPYKAPIDVPAIAQAVLTSGGRIDLTNTDVTDFINDMTSAGPASQQPVSKYEYDLQALLDAVQTFRKHRRQLIRATFEPGS